MASGATFIFTMSTVATCLYADKCDPVERESDDTKRGASAGAMTLSKGGEETQC